MDTLAYTGTEGRSGDLVSETIVRLLDAAAAAVDGNRSDARDCIARAAALVRAERRTGQAAPSAPTRIFRGGLAPWQARRVATYIEEHLAERIQARELVALTQLSTSYFFRAFRVSFGASPSAYIADRRMTRAQEMMLSTDEPLSQIAVACGLCDQSHLCRVFRRVVGMSPRAWRREHGSRAAA
jgi:AraC family transcriptional regulator